MAENKTSPTAQTQAVNWEVLPKIERWTATTGEHKDGGLLSV